MDMNKMAYPDIFVVNGAELKGHRDMTNGQVKIPYTLAPDVGIGDIVHQKIGQRNVNLKVVDCSFLEDDTLQVGTSHKHLLKLMVENSSAEPFKSSKSSIFHIGSISGEQVQVGDNNTQMANISLQQFVEHVAKSGDEEAKSKLRELLQNSSVASVLGAAATALFGML